MKVPFNDLTMLHAPIREEIDRAIGAVIDSNAFVNGPAVREFEEKFAAFCGARNCIGVGNGTDAIFIALKALGIGPGDEVITSAFGFIATSEAISMSGAQVVFVDCDERTGSMNPHLLNQALSKRTKAIVAVHLHGLPADMVAIEKFAADNDLHVLEDCAQAHGGAIGSTRVGGSGNICTFSFYPGKNLGALGDAGCIVCGDDVLAHTMRMFANHGRDTKFDHSFEGVNSRLDSLQAAVLSVKLDYLEGWCSAKRHAASVYARELSCIGVEPPQDVADRLHAYHVLPVLVNDRTEVQKHLFDAGVGTGIHYPIPLPRLNAYAGHPNRNSPFPISEMWAEKELSLPIFPGLADEQIVYICHKLGEATNAGDRKRA